VILKKTMMYAELAYGPVVAILTINDIYYFLPAYFTNKAAI